MILKLSVRELIRKKLQTLLMLIVCTAAMYTILSSLTNALSVIYQKKIFEENISADTEKVLHLDYSQTDENPEFAQVIQNYLEYIKSLSGVQSVCQFDASGMYFEELENMPSYIQINKNLLKGQKYENYPAISQLLSVDEDMLNFVKGGLTEYSLTKSGFPPVYPSEVFKDILPVGAILTNKRTKDKYEVAGYIPKGAQWVEEDDLIRFPMVSLDGWFMAPFTQQSKNDILTQLSCLHNTYIFLTDSADAQYIKQQIFTYPAEHNFAAKAVCLSDEYSQYSLETQNYTKMQIIIAVFICITAVSCVVCIFTTNALIKKSDYGILTANGFTLSDVIQIITLEIFLLIFCSGTSAWILKLWEFNKSEDIFKNVLITAHIRYTLPVFITLSVVLTFICAIIPAVKICRYKPYTLIGENTNGIN